MRGYVRRPNAHDSRKPKSWRAIAAAAVALVALSGLSSGCSSVGQAPMSETRAESIMMSLPEVQALKARYLRHPEDICFDGEGLSKETGPAAAQAGSRVWTFAIYLTSSTSDAWWPWAVFAVNARTGEVFIREPDWRRRGLNAVTYVPLNEWRKRRVGRVRYQD